MRARTRLYTAVSVAVALSLQAWALQSTLTEEKHTAAMKEIALTVSDADSHIQAAYWPELEDDADMLTSLFEQVEAYWKERKAKKASELAHEALTAAGALKTAAEKDDSDAAEGALRALRGTCQPCHREFRKKTER